jgi:hypothetical protein
MLVSILVRLTMMIRKRDSGITMDAEKDRINSGDPVPGYFQKPRSALR